MVKRDGVWMEWTYKEYYDEARTVAKAFISLGLERNCSVGILGFNSPEWFISQMGAIFAGGISTGIYTTNRFVTKQDMTDTRHYDESISH